MLGRTSIHDDDDDDDEILVVINLPTSYLLVVFWVFELRHYTVLQM